MLTCRTRRLKQANDMIPITVTKILAAASANNIATSQTPTSGTNLTINGSTASGGVATLDTQRRVLLTYGSEGSARTLFVKGTNQDGGIISETLSIPSGGSGTVASLFDYKTVTQLLPLGGGWTAAVTVGTSGVGSSRWVSVTPQVTPGMVQWQVKATGTVNYTVETTLNEVNVVGLYPVVTPQPFPVVALQSQTIDGMGQSSTVFLYWRITINSGSGSVSCIGLQGGISQGTGAL